MSQIQGQSAEQGRVSARSQTSHAVVSLGVVLGLSVLTNIIAARTLDPSGRGLLAVGIQVAAFLSAFLLFGVEKSTPVVLNESSMSRTIPLVWSASARQAGIALLVGSVLTGIGLATDLGSLDTAFVFGFPVALMAVGTMLDASFRAVAINGQRSQLVLLSTAAVSTLILFGVAGLSLADIRVVPIWLLAYGVARTGISLALHLRHGRPTRLVPDTDRAVFDQLRRTGRRLWPASFANFAALRSDRLLLPALATTADLGVYVVVSTLTDVLAAPTEALANVMLPRWRTDAVKGNLHTGGLLVLTLIYLSVSTTALVLLGPWATELLFGSAYRPSTALVVVLALASSVFGMNRLLSARVIARGATKAVSAAESSGVLFAVVGYVVLIPMYGTIGAALGSLIGYGITALGLVFTGTRTPNQPNKAGDDESQCGQLRSSNCVVQPEVIGTDS